MSHHQKVVEIEQAETEAASSAIGPVARYVLVAAPTLMMVGSWIHPAESKDGATQLAIVDAASARWTAAHALLAASAITMVFAALTLGRLVGPAAPRLARIATALAIVGAPALVGVFAMEGFGALALSGSADRASAGESMELLAQGAMPFAIVSLALFTGLCVLGVGLGRTGRAPVWAAGTLAVSAAAFMVAIMAEIEPVLYVTQALITVGLTAIAVTVRPGARR